MVAPYLPFLRNALQMTLPRPHVLCFPLPLPRGIRTHRPGGKGRLPPLQPHLALAQRADLQQKLLTKTGIGALYRGRTVLDKPQEGLLLVGSCGGVPLFELDELAEVAEDGHEADDAIVEGRQESEGDDAERVGEVGAVLECDADGDEEADEVDAEGPHGDCKAAKVGEPGLEAFVREGEDERAEEDEEKLRVDVEVRLAVDEELEETQAGAPTVVVRVGTSANGGEGVAESDLRPALRPSHALLCEGRRGFGSQFCPLEPPKNP
ncbi:hypothetical protein L1887_62168 [Cichorium endivia]|nr:hypothetical protein L1887_62168 [Cichorium endivia]